MPQATKPTRQPLGPCTTTKVSTCHSERSHALQLRPNAAKFPVDVVSPRKKLASSKTEQVRDQDPQRKDPSAGQRSVDLQDALTHWILTTSTLRPPRQNFLPHSQHISWNQNQKDQETSRSTNYFLNNHKKSIFTPGHNRYNKCPQLLRIPDIIKLTFSECRYLIKWVI